MDGQLRSDGEPTLQSPDETLKLLADRRRRHVLQHLARAPDDSISLDALSTAVREREASGERSRTVRTALHHVHLPRLADAGVVAYDSGRRRVRYLGDPMVERLLAVLDRGET